MVRDGSYTGGENSIAYRLVGSPCPSPDVNVCQLYSQLYKTKQDEGP